LRKKKLRFDKIGIWSELKLDILEKYGAAYVKAFARTPTLKKYYIDGFCGSGVHISKATGERVEGSPARALKVQPPFDHYYFIDMDQAKTDHLQNLCQGRNNVTIMSGDASDILTKHVLPLVHYEKYNRALCLLDPYGLHLDWAAIEMAGKSGAVDLVLNFPVMDMNMNAIWHNPQAVPEDGIERMNKFWGDESWRKIAYVDHPQQELFGAPPKVKQPNEIVVEAFITRLKKVAGFKHVARPYPMKNSTKAVVYYLILASAKEVAKDIVEGIFEKYDR
jgi:three-Cys-motif partner protein